MDWIAYPDASVNGGMNIMLASAGVHLHDRVVDSGRGLVVPEDVNVFGWLFDAEPLNFTLVFASLSVVTAIGPEEVLPGVVVGVVVVTEAQR